MTVRALDELIRSTRDMTWMLEAACRDQPLEELEDYFVEAGRTISRQTVARCASCPVRLECLDHAYERQIASGYFGGLSPSKRRSLSHAAARELIGHAAN